MHHCRFVFPSGRYALLLALGVCAASVHAADIFFRDPVANGPPAQCTIPAVYADTPQRVAELYVATNNALTTASCFQTCNNPTSLVSVDPVSLTFTTRSNCTGSTFNHPINIAQNPKQSPPTSEPIKPPKSRNGGLIRVAAQTPVIPDAAQPRESGSKGITPCEGDPCNPVTGQQIRIEFRGRPGHGSAKARSARCGPPAFPSQ